MKKVSLQILPVNKLIFFPLLLVVLLFSPIGKSQESQSQESISNEFEINPVYQLVQQDMNTLDLEDPSIPFEYKARGTSIGFKFKIKGNFKKYKWVPRNSATNPEAQVVSYNLARFLKIGVSVIPSTYYQIQEKATQRFLEMLKEAKEVNKHRVENRVNLLEKIAKGETLLGVITPKFEDIFAVDELVAGNTFNSKHELFNFLQAKNPQPSEDKLLKISENKTRILAGSQLNLARQFSNMMIIDVLTGQWDRWSGGNLEVILEGKNPQDQKIKMVRFIQRDNGGAQMFDSDRSIKNGDEKHKKTLKLFSRYDRNIINRIKIMKSLLSNSETQAEMINNLGLKSKPYHLLRRINDLLNKIDQSINEFGEENVFFK